MAEVPIESVVDVTVSLGTQPISTASFDSALFLADLTDVAFSDAYRIYNSLTEVVADFATTTPTYKYAALVFGGNFASRELYVVKYRTTGTVLTAVNALTATLQIDDKAYWISSDTRVDATIEALALYCESVDKMYVHASQDADILVPATTTDIASVLQDAAYNHTFTLYSAVANASFSEGGIVGAMAAIPAGTSTAEYKTLIGVTVDSLSPTAQSACKAKNAAFYMPIAGTNCLFNTKVASGQFLDTIVFSDWLKARIQESLFLLLKTQSDLGLKVSFDNAGFAQVRQAIQSVITVGLNNGSISPDVAPVVRTPNREDVLAADRANRILPDVIVEVLYSNAVHSVLVRAYVTI